MAAIIVAGIVVALLLYIAFGTTVLRLTARMVAAISPTFGSALGTIVVSLIFSVIVCWINLAIAAGHPEFGIPICLISLGVQAMIFAVMIHDSEGKGISFGQGFLIILFQIPVALVLLVALGMLFAAGGITLISLTQHQPLAATHGRTTPRLVQSSPQSATLAVALVVPAKYGNVTYAAGSPVQVLGEVQGGYRARVNGTDLVLTKAQVVFAPR